MDPLSPYLFLFCMEAFSRMLIHAQENNTLRGIRASRDGPRINHLFFADDALLFVRNKRSDIECLVNMLNTFSNISGSTAGQRGYYLLGAKKSSLKRFFNLFLRMGGLGFRDVRLFNLALLGRQVWRLLNNTDSLYFKVLSSKYFPDGNIFHAKKVDKASFTWLSIAAAVHIFKDGFGWRVGNGEKINIRADNWGMEGLNGDVVISNTLNQCVKSVKDLWHMDRRSWDVNKVKQVYGQDWSVKICDIPIGDVGGDFQRVSWLCDIRCFAWSRISCDFTCFSGGGPSEVVLGLSLCSVPGGEFRGSIFSILGAFLVEVGGGDTSKSVHQSPWHSYSRLKVGHEILPTNGKIASIRLGFNKRFRRCGADVETLLHALRDCPTSRAVLSRRGWSRSFISKTYDHCIDWLEDLMCVLDKRAMADLMTILWNCWNNRNNFIFRGKEEEAQLIWERASNLSKEFRICNMLHEPLISQNIVEKRWVKPPKGFLKINFDATVGETRIGYGTVIKDEEGFVWGGGGGFKVGSCASGRGDDFSTGQARAHRNVANDSRTKFPISG
ncbi:hypothetical protein PVK06_024970 [Gossypium arboreum]|uniref:Reverse transcriptase n=1 Tax=Gossypium arboreum TaxID=29729 RepID=A0ABR0PFI7_GOSAR|nr:hypothetical protein PVK06_024970 [Gossypium arboreum]